MKSKHKIINSIVVLLLGTSVFAYLTIPSATIYVKPGDSRHDVYEAYGKPCGTTYGVNKTSVDTGIWEKSHLLGKYRTEVYFDADKAIKSDMRFQWFYEPTLYGFQRDAGSCMQYMKHTATSRQFERVKNYIQRKTQ